MSTATTPDFCPYCRSPHLFTVECDGGPHHARTGCRDCNRHIRWVPRPITPETAAAFVMPFGKHRGLCLGEIPRDYLMWLLKDTDPKPALRRRLEVLLGQQS